MIEALTSALEADGRTLLDANEYEVLLSDLSRLQQLRESGDADGIREEIERVGKTSEEFASRRMNQGIRKALSGHKVDEFKES